jgi:hypothetical protein
VSIGKHRDRHAGLAEDSRGGHALQSFQRLRLRSA